MSKFIIERNMPSVGQSTAQEMKGACQKSNETLRDMSHPVQWQHSYVTNDKLYCVYIAENKEAIREHAAKSGFPADRIEVVQTIIVSRNYAPFYLSWKSSLSCRVNL